MRFEPVVAEGVLDAPGTGSSDALVDRECLPQMGGGFAAVAVVEAGLADAFQGACFFEGAAEVAGDGEGLGVVLPGLVAV